MSLVVTAPVESPTTEGRDPRKSPLHRILEHAAALASIALATLVSWSAREAIDPADVAMLYLVAIAIVAARLGLGPSIGASLAAVAAFDFFFVPPFFTFHVEQPNHVVTFLVMLGGGVAISTMTDRIRRRTQEAQAARSMAETEELRSAILSTVSHDLRTPLAVITGAASTLLEDGPVIDEGERRELLRSITDEAARLDRLVANLLEMSRLESGSSPVRKEWVPVEEIVGSALTRVETKLGGRSISTRLPEIQYRVAVDPILFEQVLLNLLDNAAKHTPAGTPIDVEVRAEAGALAIEVADRGPGIAPADVPRVFEKFHRGSSGTRGSGLGLAICRGIVLAHGGTIAATPREGGGVRLCVRLPVFDRIEPLPPDVDAVAEGAA